MLDNGATPHLIPVDLENITRVIGIDYGSVRVGIAVSDPFLSFSLPDTVIKNTPSLLQDILTHAKEKQVSHIVVGLPRNMDGSDSAQTVATRVFAQELGQHIPVFFWDERLSSRAVERAMLAHDASRKTRKTHSDSQAAAFILQGFLDRLQKQKLEASL